jgi:hypothetical protein
MPSELSHGIPPYAISYILELVYSLNMHEFFGSTFLLHTQQIFSIY